MVISAPDVQLGAGYKQSELGAIPEEWDVKELGELGDCIIGLTYHPANVKPYGLLVLRSSNIDDNELVFSDNVYVDLAVPEKLIVREGDILICVRNGSRKLIGKCALIDDRAVGMTFGAFMSIFRTQHTGFVFYMLQSDLIKRQINENMGATINQITNKDLRGFRIPLPWDEHEQDLIVGVLKDVDSLLTSLNRLIAKKRDIKQATMQQLLTGKTRLPGFGCKLEAGEKYTENGPIPDDWELKKLSELGTWTGGATPSMSNASYWTGGTVYWASSGDVKTTELSTTEHMITETAIKQSSTPLLPSGAILIVTRSGILRKTLPIAKTTVPMAINQDIKALVPSRQVSADFLVQMLTARGSHILSTCMKSGTTVESIEYAWLQNYQVPVPSLPEQQAIGTVLSDMDAEIAVLQQRRDKTQAVKRGMMQDLLIGRRRLG